MARCPVRFVPGTQDGGEGVDEFARGLEAVIGVALCGFGEPFVEAGGDARNARGDDDRVEADGAQDGEEGGAIEWASAGDAFEGDDAHAPEVGARVDGFALGLFWAHVQRRPQEGTAASDFGHGLRVFGFQRFRDAEVEDFDEEVGFFFDQEDVVGFQVAMDDVLLVRAHHGARDLAHDFPRVAGREASVARQARGKGFAGEEFHHQVGAFVDAEVEDLHDVRASERRCRSCLAFEATSDVGIGRQAGVDEFDGYFGTQREVFRHPHGAHAAATEFVE
jgi:hypothetical protein